MLAPVIVIVTEEPRVADVGEHHLGSGGRAQRQRADIRLARVGPRVRRHGHLQRAGEEQIRRMRQRVVDEIRTTFASGYAATISLGDVLNPATIASIAHLGTGAKVLINPNM